MNLRINLIIFLFYEYKEHPQVSYFSVSCPLDKIPVISEYAKAIFHF